MESKHRMIIQCCVCKKIKFDGVYEDAPVGYIEGVEGFFIHSHGYCPTCLAEAYKEVAKFRQSL
jgi:hypothetical protein